MVGLQTARHADLEHLLTEGANVGNDVDVAGPRLLRHGEGALVLFLGGLELLLQRRQARFKLRPLRFVGRGNLLLRLSDGAWPRVRTLFLETVSCSRRSVVADAFEKPSIFERHAPQRATLPRLVAVCRSRGSV